MLIRHLNQEPYESIWQAMRVFTDTREPQTVDEIWLVEHPPVYTLGQNGQFIHILNPGEIPVVKTDRGGQVTYHGPGQLMAYVLIDIKRLHLGVRQLVSILEESVIALLSDYGISAQLRCNAPGVYVQGAKICSVGLRIRRGCSYHGLALNVGMDLMPFQGINPCGYEGLRMTQLSDLGIYTTPQEIGPKLARYLEEKLGYTSSLFTNERAECHAKSP